ncbi:hypothetical protein FRC11_009866, partial [Ceratobasidium sp. 423]
MESLQSALARSHTPTRDSVAPTITPTLSSSALPSVSPQQPLAPSSSTIPRPLTLGTTMIVQGLVQTIEVSRIPARTTPATTNEEPNSAVEERPLLDKGKEKEEAGEASDKELAEPLASGSSPRGTSTVIPNTPASDSNTSDTLSSDALSDTTPSTLSNTDTLATLDDTSNTTPATTPRSRSSSPSSTDVLGLLLSIAAQATAEALVPWSVPPRSRTTPREGIASGLAAAFSALANAGAGVTTTNARSGTGVTVSEPAPQPPPVLQPLTPVRPADSEPRSSRRFSGLTPRRFSRLSLSPGRTPSTPSRRLSSFIPGRRASSIPVPRRASSPTRRASTPIPKPRRSVLDRIERWVPRRLRRTEAGPSRRSVSPEPEPIRDSPSPVDFGRAPPTSSLPLSALPESSVSPLPSPPLDVEAPGIEVPTPGSVSPVSAHMSSSLPTLPTAPVSPSGLPVSPSSLPVSPSSLPSPPALPPTPTTDAEDLIRFSQMLGFTPGVVHPPGSFERFLSDMQDELRVALGEYQERVRSRSTTGVDGNGGAVGVEGNVTSGAEGTEGNTAGVEREEDRTRAAALLDHTRPHVPSTDPLPLNWWRMYRFPALPGSGSRSSAASTAPTLLDEGAATLDA